MTKAVMKSSANTSAAKAKYRVLHPLYAPFVNKYGEEEYSVFWRPVGWANSIEDAKAQGFRAPVLELAS